MPNRKQRNQPSTRVHDIEFATEISTSLLSQVRNLQTLLAEKEESLRSVVLEKSRLEAESEGFHQRLRSLDESESRYKDENWNLETQIHEHIARAKESGDKEKKLLQTLNVLQLEKSAAQKELDETKLSFAKLSEEHASAVKHHDTELGGVKRSIVMLESEKGSLQRRIEDLTGQNQELAMAVAHQRGRPDDSNHNRELTDDDFITADDNVTPEHSPPPSPTKGTPRHSMLETETLKSSLGHAHRMIQNLKGNIHREKTEKLELKRMLQDARDELELKRGDAALAGSATRRSRKVESKEFKKPLKPGQLGSLRNSHSEVYMEDPDWEDNRHDGNSHSPAVIAARVAAGATAGGTAGLVAREVDSSDHFDTGNEASDAFETANERETETDDFHTGAEEMSGSDELTETEDGPAKSAARGKKPSNLNLAGNRNSFQSTASDDEYGYGDVKTPVQSQRMRLKIGRNGARRSQADGEDLNLTSSPASFATSSNSTPQAAHQSLFAELEDLGGSDEDESIEGTPSRKSIASPHGPSLESTPSRKSETLVRSTMVSSGVGTIIAPKPVMVDSGMMTEVWEPTPTIVHENSHLPTIAGAGLAGVGVAGAASTLRDKHASTVSNVPSISDAASQWHSEQLGNLLTVADGNTRPLSTSTYSDMGSQHEDMDAKLAKFPSPPTSPHHSPMPSITNSTSLSMSNILSEHVEPEPMELVVPAGPATPVKAPLAFSSIRSVETEPLSPARSPRRDGMFIPRDDSSDTVSVKSFQEPEPHTPKQGLLGSVFGWGSSKQNKEAPSTPVIAEDETRQSVNNSPIVDTPESQRPFKETSGNAAEKSIRKPKVDMSDFSSQTTLTAAEIENMLKTKDTNEKSVTAEELPIASPTSPTRGINGAAGLRGRKSQDSFGSVGRARAAMANPDLAHDSVSLKRPGSAGSSRGSILNSHPPLPSDHKQVIAAAAQRAGSSGGSQASAPGSMGPPLLPASAYKSNPSFRPRTPSQTPGSPSSVRGSASNVTPKPGQIIVGQQFGIAQVYAPSGQVARSRQSSVSSFASEVDSRFNLRNGMPLPQGFKDGTDPRMIQAITQTMIGEYLWKYTRKAGRGEMSDNRHRRYFWVHPYTRTLYWSDRDPSQAGRAELKAKSVAIEAVRVVTDDNPMPPGLHRKSLIILTPGRAVKFTATTGQRHETWFNALSYLLLRTEDGEADTENVATGALTREDVAEFNPSYGARTTGRGPASLSSYNSRTTRNESPSRRSTTRTSLQQPTLQASTSSRPSPGTFSRLSNYLKPKDSVSGSFSSRMSRQSLSRNEGSIYEASEVHDSAEDLREMIEQQDRESDKLENVRACCDGNSPYLSCS